MFWAKPTHCKRCFEYLISIWIFFNAEKRAIQYVPLNAIKVKVLKSILYIDKSIKVEWLEHFSKNECHYKMHQWPKFCCQPNFPLATISPNKFHISELNIEEVSLSEWNEIDTYVQNLPLSIVDYIWSNFRMNSHDCAPWFSHYESTHRH